jgi:hypothetical protein
MSAHRTSHGGSTYAVYRDALSIDTDSDLSALSLLYAAKAAYASSVNMSIGRADRFGQGRQCKWSANRLIERHSVCQTWSSNKVRSA